MPLPPPLKSSAAIRAASTEPMPLVSWKMPEISLRTPIRTTLPEISACSDPDTAHVNVSARNPLKPLIVVLPVALFCLIFAVIFQIGRQQRRGQEAGPYAGIHTETVIDTLAASGRRRTMHDFRQAASFFFS